MSAAKSTRARGRGASASPDLHPGANPGTNASANSGANPGSNSGPKKLQGLGPQSRTWLAQAGYASDASLLQAKPVQVFRAVQVIEPKVSLNLLYALVGAQSGRHWQAVARDDKSALLAQLAAWDEAQKFSS